MFSSGLGGLLGGIFGNSGAPYDAAMKQYRDYENKGRGVNQPYLDAGTGAISETLVNVSNNTELVTYAFTLTANSCSYNQELLLSVRPTLSLASDLTKITCSKDPFYYIGVSTASGTILSWTRTAVAGISNTTAAGVNIPVSEVLVNTTASPINVTYRYQNQLGTCSDITNVVVTVNPLPAVNVVTDKIYCSGVTVLIPLSGSSVSGTDYNWESTNVNIGLPNAGSGDISFVANNTSYVPIKSNLITVNSIRPRK
jgi:hypothetical protein